MIGLLQGLVHAVLRRRWLVAGCTGLFALAGAAAVALAPVRYEAVATVRLALADEANDAPREAVLRAQATLLRDERVRREVAEILGAENVRPRTAGPAGEIAAAMANDIEVNTHPASMSLSVAYRHADPEVAAAVANRLVSVWRRTEASASPSRIPELGRQLAEAERQLNRSLQRLESLRERHRQNAVAERRDTLTRQRQQLRGTLDRIELDIGELQHRLQTLRESLANTPREIPLSTETQQSDVVETARDKLFQLQLREQELLTTYRESSQLVQGVRQEIQRVEEFLAGLDAETTRVRMGTNPAYQSLVSDANATETRLNALRGRRDAIIAQMEELERRLLALSSQEGMLEETEAAAAQWQERVDLIASQLEEAKRLRAEGHGVPVKVVAVAEAVAPDEPASPRPVSWTATAGGAGLAAGILLAVVEALLFPRIHAARDVQRYLSLPVLACIADNG